MQQNLADPSNFHRMGYNDEEMAEILVSAMKQYIK